MKKLLFIFSLCSWLCYGHFLFAQKVEWVKKIIANTIFLDISQMAVTPCRTVGIAQIYNTDTSMNIGGEIIQPITVHTHEFYFAIVNTNGEIKKIIQPLGRYRRWVHSASTDNFNNFYIAGGCDGIAIFDTIVQNNSMFLLKYDNDGKLVQSLNSTSIEKKSTSEIMAISLNKSDNSKYISGVYSGALIINNKDTLTKGGGFVMKIDSNYNLLWSKSMKGKIDIRPLFTNEHLMASDETGVLFAGNMHENLTYTFDTLTYKVRNGDVMLQRMDNNGNILWGGLLGGEGNDGILEAKVNNGVVYINGYGYGDITFNNYKFSGIRNYGFLLALDFSTGKPLWIKKEGSYSFAFMKNGWIVTVTNFRDTLRINNKTYIPKTFTDTSIQLYSDDLYFSVLDSKTGTTILDWQMVGHGNESFPIIGADSLDNIYVLCHAQGEMELGDSIFNINWGSFLAKISLPELGVKENNNTLQASIYPNPTSSDKINLKIMLKKSEFVNLSITDVNGKKMQEDILKLYLTGENELKINTNNYPNGKYFSTLQHDGITETISFIIQK